MQAYEFYAIPENGVIPIPEHYKNLIKDNVMVIVLDKKHWQFNHEGINVKSKSDLLLSPTANTKGWKFNREEANER